MKLSRWHAALLVLIALASAWAGAMAWAGRASGSAFPGLGGGALPSFQTGPSPTPTTPTPPVSVTFQRVAFGTDVGGDRIGPGALFQMEVAVTTDANVTGATLTEFVPAGFTITDAASGEVTQAGGGGQLITWPLGDVPAATRANRIYTLQAPAAQNPPASYRFQASFTYTGDGATGPEATYFVSSSVIDDHYRLGNDTPPDAMTWLAGADGPASGLMRLQRFRLDVQVHNPDTAAVTWSPQVEWATAATGPFQRVPLDSEQHSSIPFVVQPVDSVTDGQALDPAWFGLAPQSATPAPGAAYDERNPGSLTVPAGDYSEVQFSLRATGYVTWNTSYYLRITDGGAPLDGSIVALAITAPTGPEVPTEPQYPGLPADQPAPTAQAAALAPQPLAPTPFISPHYGYTATTDACASCHRAHTAPGINLSAQPMPSSNLCFTCHDTAGTGSNYRVQADYTDPNVTPNDPANSVFYSHPATSLTPTGHVSASTDEFGGVLNRHSECVDCHDPHSANPSLPTPTSNGWQVSGALKGISGLNIANPLTPGATPVYTWTTSIAYGYQLCMKCHSGYTQLLSYPKDTDKVWDKGVEFNPNNGSTHAIEAPGKNTSVQMTNNLGSPSPNKLWTFTTSDTLRCESCHGDYRLATPGPSAPAANARLSVHTSIYRDLLMNNYRWRNLKPQGEPYSAADFALCFQCHAEAPFTASNSNVTNFAYHDLHVYEINTGSGGLDIATPGAGQGRAICAECHYRTHSTIDSYQPGTVNQGGGVNFAPNVLPDSNGVGPLIAITPGANGTPDSGACYLTCHGKDHNPETW